MLDLNETEITNESIKLITQLEYVKELRAKGIDGLTDDCAEDLNKINGLELLHVKGTNITIDGLLKLKDQLQLKTILFSAADIESIREKMLKLKQMHPHCEFIIDGKTYQTDVVAFITFIFKDKHCRYRIKIKEETFAAPLAIKLVNSKEDYYETEYQEAVFMEDIEWIEIQPNPYNSNGKSDPEKVLNDLIEIIELLESMSIPYMEVDGNIRVFIYKGLSV